jgi:hypothetical protein
MREKKITFKLQVANKADYPLIVISFDKLKALYKEDTLLDCIVGRMILAD